jgi:hypothetical protein
MAYVPTDVPSGVEDIETLGAFLNEEHAVIANGLAEQLLYERHEEPDKPFPGQLVLADGTNWDPGSGKGFYGYDGSTWRFLG